MEAMNAALEDDSEHENPSVSGHSLHSVDVMDEAMNLLLTGEGEIDLDDDLGVDQTEEEIDFDNFLKTPSDATKKAEKASDGERDNSPTSVIETPRRENEKSSEGDSKSNKTEGDSKSNKRNSGSPKQKEPPQVVPLKQFENALALIQDLENRIQVLETDRQCIQEENEKLRDTVNKQATLVADMESKLERFPKLLEQTVQEEASLAAANAEAKTKVSFWRKDMARQEQEYREEQLRKNRAGNYVATTESLKQADFLKEIVERKVEEQNGTADIQKNKGPGAIFQALRGWGNRNNKNNSNKNIDSSKKDAAIISNDAACDDEADVNESSDGFDDNGKDSKALDLMT